MLQRILLRDKQWNLFRICSFWLWLDKKNEEYIKFSFPDLKWTPLFFNDIESNDPEERLINEYSFHINWGISHFKSSNQKRFYRQENQSNTNFVIHLFAYTIYDLNHFKVFTKTIEKNDYILENSFDPNKGKVFEFHLTKIEEKIKIPNIVYNDLERKMYHPFTNEKYRLLMIEYDFININNEKTGITLYRKHNTNENFFEAKI